MTPTGIRELTVSTTMPGWVLLPEDLGEADRDRWVRAAAEEVRRMWGESRDAVTDETVREMLRASLDTRGDDPFVFDVWPVQGPFRTRVRLHVLRSGDMPDWREIGYDVSLYASSALGPGLRCVGVGEEETPAGPLDTVEWWAIFDNGQLVIAVHLEATPVLVFNQMLGGLEGFTDSLTAVMADGAAFAALPPLEVLADPEADWRHLTNGESADD
ncbi:hypothetical protein [Microbacterium sp. NPDC096154]|uniref:hypothetical protein n=1 Tax=Microbacterium sp. NPDC096154 TaxID=3155549 RepID=UPI0033170B7D